VLNLFKFANLSIQIQTLSQQIELYPVTKL